MKSRDFAINMAFIIFIVLSLLAFKVKILKHLKLSLCSKPHTFEVQKSTM